MKRTLLFIALLAAFALAGQSDAQRIRRGALVPVPVETVSDLVNTGRDATVAIQTVIDAGGTLPAGSLTFGSQLRITNSRGLVGMGPNRTLLYYTGPSNPDGAVRVVQQSWGFACDNLTLQNVADDRKGTGLRMGADAAGGAGLQCGDTVVRNLWVKGFGIGVHLGDMDRHSAVGEMTFHNLVVTGCDVGFLAADWNTLTIHLQTVGLSLNRVGLKTVGAGNLHIDTGSASYNTDTFFECGGGGLFSIRGVRCEGSGYFLTTPTQTSRTVVTVDCCQAIDSRRDDKVSILGRWGASITVRDSWLDGLVNFDGLPAGPGIGYVRLENVCTRQPSILTGQNVVYDVANCWRLNADHQAEARIGPARGESKNGQTVNVK